MVRLDDEPVRTDSRIASFQICCARTKLPPACANIKLAPERYATALPIPGLTV